MINFSKYKAILWDFDGVIMDSMSIRDKGFEVTLSSFPTNQVQQLLEYHRLNGGLSRYVKFRYFYEEILKQSIDDAQVNLLASQFSDVMMELLIDERLLISDSLNFIKRYYSELPMHIVSGSDGLELRCICEALNLTQYFISINGSPTPKKELVGKLLTEYNYVPAHTVLIGDSINDYEAAVYNKVDFLGYRNPSLKKLSENYVSSLAVYGE